MTHATPHTVLITGVTGFIGGRLATLALDRGYDVRGLARSDWLGAPGVPSAGRFLGDLPSSIPEAALQGVHTVVHCAASTEGGSERTAFAVNVTGTLRLAETARRAGVRTFVFISSQSAKPNAVSAYGRTKYQAEQALARIEGMDVVIIRPGLVSGPGSRGLFARLAGSVRKLPVVPLIGGGHQLVQPVHVDDLCEAILTCVSRPKEFAGTPIHVGMPGGISLADLLQAISRQVLGKPKPTLSVPIQPLELGVGIAGALHVPLPITKDNLQGLKLLETMDTAPDLQRLGLTLRDLPSTLDLGTAGVPQAAAGRSGATGVLLVGAGRIGLVHAVTLSRQQNVVLAGLVDRKPGAIRMLQGMGIRSPAFSDLGEAVEATSAPAAVIATPASTHLALTKAGLEHGLRLLVEKPLAVKPGQLDGYEDLLRQHPGASVQAGYTLLSSPHIEHFLRRLRAGDLGKVRRFSGFTLLSFIRQPGFKRWEVQKDLSGGGVLINSGVHVLSLIHAAFGSPETLSVQSRRQFSDEVEDCIVTEFRYTGFAGSHYASWCIEGYPRQENRLVVETDAGRLILTGSVAVFLPHAGEPQLSHQLDHDVGFNLAPDYAGSGFSVELRQLGDGTAGDTTSLRKALDLERLTFRIYAVEQRVGAFRQTTPAHHPGPSASPEPASSADTLVLDLRGLQPAEVTQAVRRADPRWSEFQVTAAQAKRLLRDGVDARRLRVTVPDFLNQSRQLAQGDFRGVLMAMTPPSMVKAGFSTLGALPSAGVSTFWIAAYGLAAETLHALPRSFNGTLLLDTYLVDLALSLRKYAMLDAMLATAKRACPHARVGIHTNLAAEALNALSLLSSPVDGVSLLSSPNAAHLGGLMREMQALGVSVTAEVGPAPAVVHELAVAQPSKWTFGGAANGLLVGLAGDSELAAARREQARNDWAEAFPGLGMPDEAL